MNDSYFCRASGKFMSGRIAVILVPKYTFTWSSMVKLCELCFFCVKYKFLIFSQYHFCKKNIFSQIRTSGFHKNYWKFFKDFLWSRNFETKILKILKKSDVKPKMSDLRQNLCRQSGRQSIFWIFKQGNFPYFWMHFLKFFYREFRKIEFGQKPHLARVSWKFIYAELSSKTIFSIKHVKLTRKKWMNRIIEQKNIQICPFFTHIGQKLSLNRSEIFPHNNSYINNRRFCGIW